MIGKRRLSQFIEDLLRPPVLDTALDHGYRTMATDVTREAGTIGWRNYLAEVNRLVVQRVEF